jgi:hypothetical protein
MLRLSPRSELKGGLVHDTLEREGWNVEIADAQRGQGLALRNHSAKAPSAQA